MGRETVLLFQQAEIEEGEKEGGREEGWVRRRIRKILDGVKEMGTE